ncbi:unnamed protein product, partial [marine sediment metagenome]
AIGELTVRIVPDTGYSRRDDAAEIRDKIHAAVGDRLRLRFEYVDDIPRSPSGKHLFLIQEVPVEEFLA